MNQWRILFTRLLATCPKGVLIQVRTVEGNSWSVFLPSLEVVHQDHLDLSGHVLLYEELSSIELPEVLSAGNQELRNDLDVCFAIITNTKGFLVERGKAKHAPFSGECLYVRPPGA